MEKHWLAGASHPGDPLPQGSPSELGGFGLTPGQVSLSGDRSSLKEVSHSRLRLLRHVDKHD